MSQFVADLLSCTLIKLSIFSMNTTAIDGCIEASQLLITLTGISRPQLILSGQARNMMQFALWTGLRTSALVALDWDDVDWLREEVMVSEL
ncbi:putative transposase [Pseudomonas sp. R3-18-08]|nr:putative transposase [Pseudomonas sp. R3-18-08]